jgi:hypothetical protein
MMVELLCREELLAWLARPGGPEGRGQQAALLLTITDWLVASAQVRPPAFLPDMSDIYRKISLYRDIGPCLAYRWCIDIVGVGFERKNTVSVKISYFLAIFAEISLLLW